MRPSIGAKLTAQFKMESYRVSQHAPIHPYLTGSLVARDHLQRKAYILADPNLTFTLMSGLIILFDCVAVTERCLTALYILRDVC